MNDNQRLGLFLILTAALIISGYFITRLPAVRAWLKGEVKFWLTPVFAAPAGRHATRNLPRPGPTEDPGTPTGPGQPGWTEDDQATETWLAGLHDDEPQEVMSLDAVQQRSSAADGLPDTLVDLPRRGSEDNWVNPAAPGQPDTAELDYDAPAPVRAIPTTPIAPGVYVPLTDDTLIDWRPEPHAGPATWHSVRNQPRTHFADLGWQWDGTTFIKEPSRVPWIRELETRPLLAIEAAVA